MNTPINTRAQTQQQDPNDTEGATQQVTIQPTQADSLRTKNLDTHHGITIIGSLDSACRRSADPSSPAILGGLGAAPVGAGDAL